jgi:uncharacterized protein (TIGR02452 family)
MEWLNLAQTAHETVAILDRGWYESSAGERVDLTASLRSIPEATQLIRPDEWPEIERRAAEMAAELPGASPTIEVTGETTLSAARRCAAQDRDVFVLNFASARRPGGGFLGGAVAQEESLARASGLYASLRAAPEYYRANRACEGTFYTDHAIYSPSVPVFRDDEGALLREPYSVTFVTMPAVNKDGMHPQPELGADVMERRIRRVLSLGAVNHHRTLVLGAWGCGAFRNDAEVIARLFAGALNGDFGRAFQRIVFAVYDNSRTRSVYAAFAARFACRAAVGE